MRSWALHRPWVGRTVVAVDVGHRVQDELDRVVRQVAAVPALAIRAPENVIWGPRNILCSEFVIRNIAWAPETVPGRPNPKAAAVLAAGGVLGQVAVRTLGLGIEGVRLVALAIAGVDRVRM